MSVLGRLFGSRPAPAAPNTVVIPEDLAQALTSGGAPLGPAVEEVLRSHVEARAGAGSTPETSAMPFWLDRGRTAAAGDRADIEDELRSRVIERHAGEGDS